MRFEARIPHPSVLISVFRMNEKYIVKMEAGSMEQCFKFSDEGSGGVEGLTRMFDEEFMQKVISRFNEMFLEMQRVKKIATK